MIKNEKWEIFLAFDFQTKDTIDPSMVSLFIIMLLLAYVPIFFFCEFGECITSEFNGLDDDFIQLDWHSFPIEIKHQLPITVAGLQQPVVIQGFGNLVFTRDAFKKVC